MPSCRIIQPIFCQWLLIAIILSSSFDPPSVSGFAPTRLAAVGGSVVGRLHVKTSRDDDFPPEEYTGDVDWDAEWKKVVKEQKSGGSKQRPGTEYYKSEAEVAAIRAANKATKQVDRVAEKVAANLPTMPTFDALKGDWKFWIGVIAIISVGTALLSASAGPSEFARDPESFYI